MIAVVQKFAGQLPDKAHHSPGQYKRLKILYLKLLVSLTSLIPTSCADPGRQVLMGWELIITSR